MIQSTWSEDLKIYLEFQKGRMLKTEIDPLSTYWPQIQKIKKHCCFQT